MRHLAPQLLLLSRFARELFVTLRLAIVLFGQGRSEVSRPYWAEQ